MLGLAQMSQWRQDALFDPTNPHQQQHVQYAQLPGTYGSWYYSQVPADGGSLMGLGISQVRPLSGVSDEWNKLPSFVQAGLVLVASATIGFFGWKKFGTQIKKTIGLSGRRRR